MENHPIATRAAWIDARKQLLAKEKELTRLRDELSQKRRDLPWVARHTGQDTLDDLVGVDPLGLALE
jgi:predicted dithiol-disulfide oxidoreductase (DUF899 family)